MSRVIAIVACGLILAACSMSMPSMDFFRSGPATEVLRIESEPPGADARTAEGQSCRTPCELTVPATGEVPISFALQGYQPQTINVRAEHRPQRACEASPARLQPNPVYAELTPSMPPPEEEDRRRPRKRSPPRKPALAPTVAAPAGGAPPPPAPRRGSGELLSVQLSLAAAAAAAIQ